MVRDFPPSIHGHVRPLSLPAAPEHVVENRRVALLRPLPSVTIPAQRQAYIAVPEALAHRLNVGTRLDQCTRHGNAASCATYTTRRPPLCESVSKCGARSWSPEVGGRAREYQWGPVTLALSGAVPLAKRYDGDLRQFDSAAGALARLCGTRDRSLIMHFVVIPRCDLARGLTNRERSSVPVDVSPAQLIALPCTQTASREDG